MAHSHLFLEATTISGLTVCIRYSHIVAIYQMESELHCGILTSTGVTYQLQYEFAKMRHHLNDQAGIFDSEKVKWHAQ